MTTQEAIKIIGCYDIGFYDLSGEKIPAEKLVEAFDMAIEALQDRPTIDAVEVVRCKDCKYSKHLKQYPKVNTWKCTLTDVVYRADDFCSYGERREEE